MMDCDVDVQAKFRKLNLVMVVITAVESKLRQLVRGTYHCYYRYTEETLDSPL